MPVDTALQKVRETNDTFHFAFEDISALNLEESVLNLVIEYLHCESQVAALNWMRRVSQTCVSLTSVGNRRPEGNNEFKKALWAADGLKDQREMYRTTSSYLSSAVRNCVFPVSEPSILRVTEVLSACSHAMKTSSQMSLTILSTCIHRILTLQRLVDCKCIEEVQCVMFVPNSRNDVKQFVAGLYTCGRYVFDVGANKVDFSILTSAFAGDSEIHQTHGLDCVPVRLREDVKVNIVWEWVVSQTQASKSFFEIELLQIERLYTTSKLAYNFATVANQDLIDNLCFRRVTVPQLDTSRPESVDDQTMICADWYLKSIPFSNTFVLALLVHRGCSRGMTSNTVSKNALLCALTRAAAIRMSDECERNSIDTSHRFVSNEIRDSQQEPDEKLLDTIDMQNQFVDQLSNKISSAARGASPSVIAHDLLFLIRTSMHRFSKQANMCTSKRRT